MRIAALAWLLLAPAGAIAQTPAATASVSACFTPPSGCGAMIVDLVGKAAASIRVQAYVFTSAPIIQALAAAHRRGVDVQVVLDRVNDRGRYSRATFLARAGVPVWIDRAPAIAHSKIIILDGETVIGGSFNYSRAADTRNAENVTVMRGQEVAAAFGRNWEARRAASERYAAP